MTRLIPRDNVIVKDSKINGRDVFGLCLLGVNEMMVTRNEITRDGSIRKNKITKNEKP